MNVNRKICRHVDKALYWVGGASDKGLKTLSYSLEQLQEVGISAPSDSGRMTPETLTSQQEDFCQAYVFGGMTKSAAYRLAYNVGEDTKPATTNAAACRLSYQSHVAARIQQLRASRSSKFSLDTVRIKDSVINQLMETLEHSDNEKLKLQAAVALAKMPVIGLYDKPTDGENETTGDTVLELKAIVSKLKDRITSDEEEKTPSKPKRKRR